MLRLGGGIGCLDAATGRWRCPGDWVVERCDVRWGSMCRSKNGSRRPSDGSGATIRRIAVSPTAAQAPTLRSPLRPRERGSSVAEVSLVSGGKPLTISDITSRDLAFQRNAYRIASDAPYSRVLREARERPYPKRKSLRGANLLVLEIIRKIDIKGYFRGEKSETTEFIYIGVLGQAMIQQNSQIQSYDIFFAAPRLEGIIFVARDATCESASYITWLMDAMKLWFGCSGVLWLSDGGRIGGDEVGAEYLQKSSI